MIRTLSRAVYLGCLIIPSFVCLILVFAGTYNIVSLWQEETEAKNKLESALKTIPVIPDDVLVEATSGKEFGGTMGCLTYHIEQVHALNTLNMSEILNFYSAQLTQREWSLDSAYNDGRTFIRTGDVHLGIYKIREMYWYYRFTFDYFSSFGKAFSPNIQKINEAKKDFKTVFTVSLLTFPPVDDRKCRGG